MSIQAVQQFNQIAKDDLEIKKSLDSITDPKSFITRAIELSSERGFSFTANDLEQYYAQESSNIRNKLPRNPTVLAVISGENQENIDVCAGLPYLAYQMCQILNSKK
jgi:hypothetical protein